MGPKRIAVERQKNDTAVKPAKNVKKNYLSFLRKTSVRQQVTSSYR